MPSRPYFSSPRPGLIVIRVSGERNDAEARDAIEAFVAYYRTCEARQILLDATQAHYVGSPEDLYGYVAKCGEAMPAGKIAIVSHDLDSVYARFWRRGLSDTGHETAVFTCEDEADAWLATEAEADILFLA
ncbi:MAG: hypothetical protein LAT81_05665 [Oceanicaulis sp.]|nr:hypothetical protein [Oceanicaulis sp.]